MSTRLSVLIALSSHGLFLWSGSATAGQPDPDGNFPKTGLKWWVSAEKVDLGTGNAVKTLADRSGNDNPAIHTPAPDDQTQPTLAVDPWSGLPVLSFSGVKTGLEFKRISDIRTTFWVLSKDPKGAGRCAEQTPFGDTQYSDFHVGCNPEGIFNTAVNAGHLSELVANGKTYLNGKLINPQSVPFPSKLSLISVVTTGDCRASLVGKDRNMDRSWIGAIAEMLVYNVALTDADRVAVETYLIGKYGLDGNPPVKLDGGAPIADAAIDVATSAETGGLPGAGGAAVGGSSGAAGAKGSGGSGGAGGSTATSGSKGGSESKIGTTGGSAGRSGGAAGGSSEQGTPANPAGCDCQVGKRGAREGVLAGFLFVAPLAWAARRRRRPNR